jgi:hypothetical protein
MVNQENFIGYYSLSHEICDELIAFHKNSNKKFQGKTITPEGAKSDSEVKDSTDISFYKEKIMQEPLIVKYLDNLKRFVANYMEKYKFAGNGLRLKVIELNVQHYRPNGGYKVFHYENGTEATKDRHLVFMTYLNDVEDGGTIFKYQNLITPAIKGSTLLWPANWTHTHKGQITDTSEKYIITGWLERE